LTNFHGANFEGALVYGEKLYSKIRDSQIEHHPKQISTKDDLRNELRKKGFKTQFIEEVIEKYCS
jgi:SOS response regulatory protein OraA/RecX